MSENLIYVALSTFALEETLPKKMLEDSGVPFRIHSSGKRITANELIESAGDATVILAGVETYDVTVLEMLKKLRCISRLGAGVDSIDLKVAKKKNIVVMNTPMIPVEAVAELALSMILSLSRNLYTQSSLMHARRWERLPAHLLSGRTVGLFGFGKIGQRVAQLCNAFKAKVIAYDPFIDTGIAKMLGVEIVDKQKLLKEADIISIHASSNKVNPVIIGSDEIATMKEGVILVNLARGEMVDEVSLIDALRSGKIAAAGLDVYSKEPYQGPLCDFNQVILTPHSATLTFETRSAMEIQCVENAIGFLNGKIPVSHRVV